MERGLEEEGGGGGRWREAEMRSQRKSLKKRRGEKVPALTVLKPFKSEQRTAVSKCLLLCHNCAFKERGGCGYE